MAFVIMAHKLKGLASMPSSGVPGYLKRYDPEAHDGRGDATFTNDKNEAIRFASLIDAWIFWKQVPKSRPVRQDGEPNRPLTAFTITIEPMEKEL
jgi:hypothetical protein